MFIVLNPDEFFADGEYSIFSITMTGVLFTLVGLYVIINCFIYFLSENGN